MPIRLRVQARAPVPACRTSAARLQTVAVLMAALAALSLAGGAASAAPASAPVGDAERGRLLYETGADASGRELRAQRLGAGSVARVAVACVSCHRPSTMGGTEGGLLVPPITGNTLFAAARPPSTRMNMQWMRHQTRSAYTSAGFATALTQGTDPDGHALGPEMPRYQIDPQQAADLEAYLRARGNEAIPGLKDGVMQLATVFTPDAPAARRDTVRQVMQAWASGLKLGPVAVRWSAWDLQGDPSGWRAQLEALQSRTPVFALVSGAGGAQWSPVQAFCEHHRIACLMPALDRVPDMAVQPRYSVYLSAGVEGEAHMLQQWLASQKPRAASVLQVWQGAAAQQAMLTLKKLASPTRREWADTEWRAGDAQRPNAAKAAVVVLWLRSEEATAWLRAHRPGAAQTVYLSSQLAPAQSTEVPAAWRGQVRWVSMRALPANFYGALAASLEPWAQTTAARGVASAVDFADARAAAFLFGDAAGLSQGVLRPDYLIERLETAVQQRTAATVYILPSLGPGQRVASKGGVVFGYRSASAKAPVALSPYLRATP